MSWKRKVNTALEGVTGYRLLKPQDPPEPPQPERYERYARPPADPKADRLLVGPVFILSSVRSGSTLLQALLGGHSQLHAPHELHVRRLKVELSTPPVGKAMDALGHNRADLEHLLWDRVMHRELVRSGKRTIVEKTPSNVFTHRRLAICWPDARFIFLLRHPMSIAQSWHDADPIKRPMERAVTHTYEYMRHLEHARQRLDGVTVTYEDLTVDPEGQLRRVCDFLGIQWEAQMLTYSDNGFEKGIGDWRDKIRTGTVQDGRPLPAPDEIPEPLRGMARAWGYLTRRESSRESATSAKP